MTGTEDRLRRALGRAGRPSSDYDLNRGVVLPENRRLRTAAVLIGVSDRAGREGVWLTKRTPTLKHHPGQIAFPGGKTEPGEDALDTALREAGEEIGLKAAQARVLGTLPSHETVTGFVVTPVLAMIDPDFRPEPENGEVAEVFETPLAHLLAAGNYMVESRWWRGQRRSYLTVPWGPYYIWGATARMLRALADRMDADDAD